MIAICASIPSFGLTVQIHDVPDPAFSEALAAEQADLNLSQIHQGNRMKKRRRLVK